MKKSLYLRQLAGFLFTGIAGTLLHFAYDWSGQNRFFALFSAVNESIWEHMKLLFFPMLGFAFWEHRFIGSQYGNFWCAKLACILAGLTAIPVLYYSYTGIFGVSKDWINIIIFFVAAALSYTLETRMLKENISFPISCDTARLLLYLLGLLFIILTFIPPHIPLFQDPVTGTYGIQKGL